MARFFSKQALTTLSRVRFGFVFAVTLFSLTQNSCGGGALPQSSLPLPENRDMTGNFSNLTSSTLVTRTTKKTRSLNLTTCTQAQVCCVDYNGTATTATLDASCGFDITLDVGTFYYCGVFSGSDADDSGCGDNYIASLGCSDNGYAGEIPLFAGVSRSDEAIDLGTVDIQGVKGVSANNLCAVIDQDDDGTADASDTDDDGDATVDLDDLLAGSTVREGADELDSDSDGVPDIFENLWGLLDDSDSDGVPDFFDSDFSCSVSATDLDGNCIPDAYDKCVFDGDSDGVTYCVDCDDDDASVTVDCYNTDYCAIDTDGDGYTLCDDCDDWDITETYECFGGDFCTEDNDADGYGWCQDCDDSDNTISTECYYDSSANSDFCAQDLDGDGLNICRDCDDYSSAILTECYVTQDYGNLCLEDNDADGYGYCYDCNDYDSTSTFECYDEATSWCEHDNDSDGVNVCSDCDDFDSTVTIDCYGSYEFCQDDFDSDGVGYCYDCNDNNADVGTDCSDQDYDLDGVTYFYDCNDYDDTITSSYLDDVDADGYGACYDCDDTDSLTTYECYGSYDYCSEDYDSDGVNYCEDCNDWDATVITTYSTDFDNDGYAVCYDCNDNDSSTTYECNSDYSYSYTCSECTTDCSTYGWDTSYGYSDCTTACEDWYPGICL